MSPARKEQLGVVLVLSLAAVLDLGFWLGLGYVIWRLL